MPNPFAVTRQHPVVIAIPARDEEERIGACLGALADQIGAAADHIVLLINNTTDRTAALARGVQFGPETTLHVLERSLPPHQSNAGFARRLAMEEAAKLAGPCGVLLTTDADGRADSDWLAANLAALAEGADAVAGWVDLDPAEWSNIPMALHEADARECAYDTVCNEIEAWLDPCPHDPLPRHTQESGASIAVTAEAFARVGGIPPVVCGEDRAFLAALKKGDARIRHTLACHVVVSGRTEGRAAGGMADTIRRRLKFPDVFLDPRLEPAADCAARARLRRLFRACFLRQSELGDIPALLGLDLTTVHDLLAIESFGAAWNAAEAVAPLLRRRPVAVAALAEHMAAAVAIRDSLAPHARRAIEPSVGAS